MVTETTLGNGKRVARMNAKELQEQFVLLRGHPIWDRRPSDAKRLWAQLKARESALKEREHTKSRVPFTPEERAAMRRKAMLGA